MSTLQTTNLKHPDSSASQITFTSGGDIDLDSAAVFIDSSHNLIGFGTSSPTSPIHVVGSSSGGFLGGGIRINDTANSSDWFMGGAVGGSFQIAEAAGSTRMIFDTSGNVGIAAIPVAKLDVNGTQVSNVVAMAGLDVDCSLGNYFTKTINGNSTFTFSNVPASRAFSFVLELTHTSGTVTWPSSVKFPADTAPTLTTGKTHLFVFISDSGSTRFRAATVVDYVN
ncbi:MAG: hypothetical protein CMK37_07540 [Porticoccaceae bacterium]|nr:hypothetical protein [Porticoccaceae bacterium]|tara:strand:- start:23996 stop:24670 length:675 start_codon:yes stop_codon:yes gene_type:complete